MPNVDRIHVELNALESTSPLRERDILAMPTTVPGISVSEARRTPRIRDQLLIQFPEVKIVLGKIGRAMGGNYLDTEVDRDACARHGLSGCRVPRVSNCYPRRTKQGVGSGCAHTAVLLS